MTLVLSVAMALAAVAFVLHPVLAGVWAPMADDDVEHQQERSSDEITGDAADP